LEKKDGDFNQGSGCDGNLFLLLAEKIFKIKTKSNKHDVLKKVTLVVRFIENDKHYLIGITSYAAKKCDDGIRFVNLFIRFLYMNLSSCHLRFLNLMESYYTRVSSYLGWIEQTRKSMAIQMKAANLWLLLTAVLIVVDELIL
jgi:hypothetical protein